MNDPSNFAVLAKLGFCVCSKCLQGFSVCSSTRARILLKVLANPVFSEGVFCKVLVACVDNFCYPINSLVFAKENVAHVLAKTIQFKLDTVDTSWNAYPSPFWSSLSLPFSKQFVTEQDRIVRLTIINTFVKSKWVVCSQ